MVLTNVRFGCTDMQEDGGMLHFSVQTSRRGKFPGGGLQGDKIVHRNLKIPPPAGYTLIMNAPLSYYILWSTFRIGTNSLYFK